jgi:hypothetical protein
MEHDLSEEPHDLYGIENHSYYWRTKIGQTRVFINDRVSSLFVGKIIVLLEITNQQGEKSRDGSWMKYLDLATNTIGCRLLSIFAISTIPVEYFDKPEAHKPECNWWTAWTSTYSECNCSQNGGSKKQ